MSWRYVGIKVFNHIEGLLACTPYLLGYGYDYSGDKRYTYSQ